MFAAEEGSSLDSGRRRRNGRKWEVLEGVLVTRRAAQAEKVNSRGET